MLIQFDSNSKTINSHWLQVYNTLALFMPPLLIVYSDHNFVSFVKIYIGLD